MTVLVGESASCAVLNDYPETCYSAEASFAVTEQSGFQFFFSPLQNTHKDVNEL